MPKNSLVGAYVTTIPITLLIPLCFASQAVAAAERAERLYDDPILSRRPPPPKDRDAAIAAGHWDVADWSEGEEEAATAALEQVAMARGADRAGRTWMETVDAANVAPDTHCVATLSLLSYPCDGNRGTFFVFYEACVDQVTPLRVNNRLSMSHGLCRPDFAVTWSPHATLRGQ